MFKIKLNTPIKDIRGNQLIASDQDPEGKITRVKVDLRYDLLKVLGARYDDTVLPQPREYTWIYNLSTVFNGKENEVEVSEEKIEFLRRLVRNNASVFPIQTAQGEVKKEKVDILLPFEKGQIMILLGDPDATRDEEPEDKKK